MEENDKSVLIMPDVHGRDFWREGLKQRLENELVVFLGDYTDPYPDEHISHDVIPEMIEEILQIPNTILLLGNHDLSYIYPDYSPHVRYDYIPERRKRVMDIFEKNHDRFTFTYTLERKEFPGDIIFSHAGLLMSKYHRFDCRQKQTPKKIAKWFNDAWKNQEDDKLITNLFEISWLRGGIAQYGSLVWADVREHFAEKHLFWSHDYQVFGHTMLIQGHLIEESQFAMIDCRRPVRMWYNNKKPVFKIL